MTNTQIIINEAIANGLYTKEEVEAILETGHMIPLHTFQTWKSAGYIVRKGEHAKSQPGSGNTPARKNLLKRTVKQTAKPLIITTLQKHFFFTADQVEKIATA